MLCYVLSYYGVSIINQSIWKCAHSAADWSSFKSLRNQYHKLILSCKKDYYSSLVSSASDNPKRLWQTVNKLLHRKKILLTATHHFSWHFTCRELCFFHRQNMQKVSHQQPCYIISALIATWLLKECSSVLVPTITNIVNFSLTSGQFLSTLKESIISPLLKKPTLDKEELCNYRPISNLSLISKIIERVVKSHHSAYCKHHSTETALLYIHGHLISAVGSQKVSCLCLLDLSAAFGTIDHDILITRLSSWFGIRGFVLIWFKSYLSYRCFRVKYETDLSSCYTSSCGVPQGSVLGPLLFTMYTTPLSTLISSFPKLSPLHR